MKRTICLALSLALSALAFAQSEADLFGSEDDALSGDDGIESVEQGSSDKAVTSILKTESVRVGGKLSASVSPSWTWTDPYSGSNSALDPDSQALSPELEGTVFFDGRPNEETRFYGSVKTSYPFSSTESYTSGWQDIDLSGTMESSELTTSSFKNINLSVFELFVDRSWGDRLYFRFGKHTVKWGVGYFWSPADVLNLTEIDVTDPTAQLEGPVNLRLNVPIPGTQNNIWAYALLPDAVDPEELEPEDIGWALKWEQLLGNCELGVGGFYQKDRAPKAMLTATGALWKFNLFGEAVAGWGRDKLWASIDTTAPVSVDSVTTYDDDDSLYLSATLGFAYIDSKRDFTAYCQYYWNGEGYSDGDRKDLIRKAHVMIDSSPTTSELMTSAFKALIYDSGRHYLGLYLLKEDVVHDHLSLSLLSVTNLSDLSGMIQPAATWEFFDGFSLELNPSFWWAANVLWGAGSDGEYTVLAGGPAVSISLKATLGTGEF